MPRPVQSVSPVGRVTDGAIRWCGPGPRETTGGYRRIHRRSPPISPVKARKVIRGPSENAYHPDAFNQRRPPTVAFRRAVSCSRAASASTPRPARQGPGREVYEARGLASQPREVFPRIDSSCWRVAAPGPARETLAGLRRIKKVGDAPGALSVGRDGRENCSVAAAPTFPAGLP